MWRNCDFPTEDDDLEKCALELFQTATIKPRQIERSVFFYWTTADKLEFTDWYRFRRMFGCGENAILKWRRMIAPPPPRKLGLNNKSLIKMKNNRSKLDELILPRNWVNLTLGEKLENTNHLQACH